MTGKEKQGFLQGYRYALKLTATVQLCKCQNPLNYIHLIEIAINLKILPSSSPIFLGIDHKNILWPTLQMIGFSVPYPAIFSRKGHRDQKEVEKHFLFLPFLSAITSHPSVQSYFYSHPGFIKPQHKNRPIHPPFWVFSLKALMSGRVKPGSDNLPYSPFLAFLPLWASDMTLRANRRVAPLLLHTSFMSFYKQCTLHWISLEPKVLNVPFHFSQTQWHRHRLGGAWT